MLIGQRQPDSRTAGQPDRKTNADDYINSHFSCESKSISYYNDIIHVLTHKISFKSLQPFLHLRQIFNITDTFNIAAQTFGKSNGINLANQHLKSHENTIKIFVNMLDVFLTKRKQHNIEPLMKGFDRSSLPVLFVYHSNPKQEPLNPAGSTDSAN